MNDATQRQRLASNLTTVSIIAILLLGAAAIAFSKADDRAEASSRVMAAVLPLLGSWVATVLAYYFAKENLRAATDSVSTLMSSQSTKLALSVKDKMIERTRIVSLSDKFENLPDALLKDIVDYLATWKVSRSPVFRPDKTVSEVVHTSTVNDFIQQRVAAGAELQALKYSDLQADLKLGQRLKSSLAFVSATASVADARASMNATPGCEDVFVTSSGKPNEPVLGWITDNIILEAQA